MLSWDMITECEHHQLGFTSLQSRNWTKAETWIVSLQDQLTPQWRRHSVILTTHSALKLQGGLSVGASHLSEEHPNLPRANLEQGTPLTTLSSLKLLF